MISVSGEMFQPSCLLLNVCLLVEGALYWWEWEVPLSVVSVEILCGVFSHKPHVLFLCVWCGWGGERTGPCACPAIAWDWMNNFK